MLPEDPAERLQAMMVQLAAAGAQARHKGDAAAARTLEELRRRMDVVVQQVRARLAEGEQRAQLARQIDQLVDSVPDLASHAAALKTATRAESIGPMGEGLRVIAEWIGMPSETAGKPLDELVARVRAVTGVAPDHDEARATGERMAAIEADVKQKLEAMFRELGIPAPI